MSSQIQADMYLMRRDTSERWALFNPILPPGELVLESDTKMIKIGDGVTPYNDLGYAIQLTDDVGAIFQALEVLMKTGLGS